MTDDAHLAGGNALYLEALYRRFCAGDDTLSPEWRAYFEAQGAGDRNAPQNPSWHPSWKRDDWPPTLNGEMTATLDGNWQDIDDTKNSSEEFETLKTKAAKSLALHDDAAVRAAALDSVRAIMMIRAYRFRGHLAADLDPLGLEAPKSHSELDPASYGFTPEDYDRPIFIDNVLGLETATINQMLEILRRTYCGSLALEFMHISDPEEKSWLQERMEGPDKEITFTQEGKRAILQKLIEAEGLETYLQVKFIGTKRFGLDGGEAAIPALEQIIKRGGNLGVEEIVIGMPHRGRLNVLTNVMGKPFRALFHEFKGGSSSPEDTGGSGDVKYHLGASSDRSFDDNSVHLSLTANPSHLEAVDPVVLGKARAKQDQYKQTPSAPAERGRVIPLLMHGDAAFAGQGIVAECLGLSGLVGHKSGGAIHFIVNNQIGFTTAPRFSRSSPYPSDVAKMVEAPIFHVNGDDPEAVVYAAKVATEFRQKFLKPVVIDMFCYRRFGHNENDEPFFTQPHMYRRIKQHEKVAARYAKRLINEGTISQADYDAMLDDYRTRLDNAYNIADEFIPGKADWLDGKWMGIEKKNQFIRGETGIDEKMISKIGNALTKVPADFNIHRTLARAIEARRTIFKGETQCDWATAEALAFGSLLLEGHGVRLSGQDSERGTFSQRHAVWLDQESEARHIPLHNLDKNQAGFEVINSMLSEAAVLGFEYGYSLAEPSALVMWEAQYGDFANGAQVMIDQFIASGEIKWLRMSGLVLLLPHGYEGQGPEHSSARLERYLQLCAEDNIQVANCTTPANYFHILRRQVHRNFRKPLILMTPKSLLRHKQCVSPLQDMLTDSTFHRVLPDDEAANLAAPQKARRVILCSGKVYYDLLAARSEAGIDDVYLIRLEQLYPYPHSALMLSLRGFEKAEFVWCQEEPHNMGAWHFIAHRLEATLSEMGAANPRPLYAGRAAAAATAAGLMRRHEKEQQAFLTDALTGKCAYKID